MRYKLTFDLAGAAQFTVPLIVGIPKGNYSAVPFVENGKKIKVVKQ